MKDKKKNVWTIILQTVAAIITAALTALGTASCVAHALTL